MAPVSRRRHVARMNASNEPPANRGITPVIGAVLMITITVLLAAVVGTLTLGYGPELLSDPPQASFSVSFDTEADQILIEHLSGDQIDSQSTRLVVEVDGTEAIFDPTSSSTLLTVSGTAVIDTDDASDPDDDVDWDGDGTDETYEPRAGGDVLPPLAEGDTVTVQLVDVDEDLVFFETTLTV